MLHVKLLPVNHTLKALGELLKLISPCKNLQWKGLLFNVDNDSLVHLEFEGVFLFVLFCTILGFLMWTFVFNLLLHYDSWKAMFGSKSS